MNPSLIITLTGDASYPGIHTSRAAVRMKHKSRRADICIGKDKTK